MFKLLSITQEYSYIQMYIMNCNFWFTVLNYTKYPVTQWQKARLYDTKMDPDHPSPDGMETAAGVCVPPQRRQRRPHSPVSGAVYV